MGQGDRPAGEGPAGGVTHLDARMEEEKAEELPAGVPGGPDDPDAFPGRRHGSVPQPALRIARQ